MYLGPIYDPSKFGLNISRNKIVILLYGASTAHPCSKQEGLNVAGRKGEASRWASLVPVVEDAAEDGWFITGMRFYSSKKLNLRSGLFWLQCYSGVF